MSLSPGQEFTLPCGRESRTLALPPSAEVTVLEAQEQPPEHPPEALIAEALAHPFGAPQLPDCVRGAESVVIVISDKTRPCPSRQLLPPVLEFCARAGVDEEDVVVISALGSHSPQTDGERRVLVGPSVWDRVRVVDSDPEAVAALGETAAGTPVEIDRRVVEADAVVALGNIDYHYFAGYSGGLKAIVPGCASVRAITANHSLMARPEAVAATLASNPVRADLEEAARRIEDPFILNAVLDGEGRIVGAVAGDPITAHRAGCRILDRRNQARLSEPAPVVVASVGGHPKDVDLYQAQKGLDNAARALEPGGTLVLVAECREGFGHPVFSQWMLEEPDPAARIRRLEQGFVLGGHKAAVVSRVMLKAGQVALVSALPSVQMERIGFTPYPTVQAAVDAALAKHGPDARVVLMPHAGATLPIVGKEARE